MTSTLACARCGHDLAADARFCASCGAPAGGAGSLAPTRKHVCVLFVDIVDSTGLAEATDPELLRTFLARYFDRVSALIWRHGGTVEKFIGDAVMAVFGVPVTHEDDALRALRAARQIIETVSGPAIGEGLPIDREIAVRVGVNAGEVFVTQQPDGQFSITGDAVNVAARLQTRAGPGQVCLSQSVAALAGAHAQLEYLGEVVHRGRSRPEGVYRLISLGSSAAGSHTGTFVGRQTELGDLRTLVERTANRRQGWLVTIVGDAGLGKSRLLHELSQGTEGLLVLRASVQPNLTFDGTSLAFLGDLLSGVATDWPAVVTGLLGTNLAGPVLARLTSALGQSEVQTTVEDVAWAMAHVLSALSRDHPLMVVWDDLHWASEPQLDFILLLVQELRNNPILTVCLTRPELFRLRPWWGGGPRSRVEHLEPLAQPDLERMAEEWRRERGGDPATVEGIIARSDGNPLVLRMLLEAAGDGAEIPVAAHALYEAALDRLSPMERAFCEAGAVFGRQFPVAGAGRVMGRDHGGDPTGAIEPADPGELVGLVDRLCALDVLERTAGRDASDGMVRFTQSLLMQTAYSSMPKQVRATRHERAADWLIERGAGGSRNDGTIAVHLRLAVDALRELEGTTARSADLRERAVMYGLSALRDQVVRGDAGLNTTARQLAGIIAPGDERLIGVVLTLWLHRSSDTGRRLFREGLAVAEVGLRSSDVWQSVRVIPGRMEALGAGQVNARDLLAEASRLVEELESSANTPPAALLFAYLFASQVTGDADEPERCRELIQRGLELARRCGDVGAERVFRSGALQASLVSDDDLDRTIALAEQMSADLGGVRGALPMLHGVLAAAYAMSGEQSRAVALWEAAAEPRGSLSNPALAFVETYHCEVLVAGGATLAGAEEYARLASTAAGVPLLQVELGCCAARFYLYAGAVDSARRSMVETRERVRATGSAPRFEARLLLLDAAFAALDGDPDRSRTLVDRARALGAGQVGPLARGYFQVDLAAALLLLGAAPEARAARAEAHSAFALKGAVALAGQVDGWLDAVRRLADGQARVGAGVPGVEV